MDRALLHQLKRLAALFLGLGLFSTGFGLLMSVVALKLTGAGYNDLTTGLVNAAFYLGGIIGSVYCARYIAGVGHIRTFAAFAALLAVFALAHALFLSAWGWALLRLASGFLFYGLIMTVESWLNQRATAHWRGRILSLYMVLYFLAYIMGQLLLNVRTHSNSTLFVISGMLIAVSLVPVAVMRADRPEPADLRGFSLSGLLGLPLLATAGAFAGGLMEGAFFTLAPIYAARIGLSTQHVSLLVTAGILGGLAFQWPLGLASDFISRRGVIAAGSCLTAAPAFLLVLAPHWPFLARSVLVFICGGGLFALYSLSLAHATDYATAHTVADVNRNLLLANALGAVVAPAAGGALMLALGAKGLFVLLACVSLSLLPCIPTARTLPRRLRGVFVPIPQQTTYAAARLDPRRDRDWTERGRAVRRKWLRRHGGRKRGTSR